ncbi:MAG: DUF5662 family protein [Rickettsiales bacterium]|jgi:hypothetical protein|nr:DUF5662 family protein [Rickettsiales bacterium]
MNNYWKHFKTIITHKYYVFMEMKEYGLYWQGLVHDMSKFTSVEFKQAKYYRGTGSPIDAEKKEIGYSASWLHHFHNNKHHWEYWYDATTGKLAPIPEKHLKEMVCDIIGASKAYNRKNWTPDKPIEYMKNNSTHPQKLKDILIPMLEKKLGGR